MPKEATMHELILHNYQASPFAEKVRLLMGFKQLSWRWVEIPRIMPKPQLTALTGGYRKTPVLQVGADIYCDSALIARRLDAEKASPPLLPEGLEFVSSSFAQWADSVVFLHAVSLSFHPEAIAQRMAALSEAQREAFLADRGGLFQGGSASRLPLQQALQQWPVLMARLEQQLGREEGDFLFGPPSIADFSLAHCLWYLRAAAATAALVEDWPAVTAWLGRVLGFGHGAHSRLEADAAIAIARAATPAALPDEAWLPVANLQAGQRVRLAATDYGVDPIEGELVFAGSEELILRREDPLAGVLHVHFPRIGFRLEAC
jgi:glutathione S-transferase